MRTTIDLPEDLHSVMRSLAVHSRRSLSATAVELIRQGLALPLQPGSAAELGFETDSVTGLPVLTMARRITPEDVKALDDE